MIKRKNPRAFKDFELFDNAYFSQSSSGRHIVYVGCAINVRVGTDKQFIFTSSMAVSQNTRRRILVHLNGAISAKRCMASDLF